MDPMMLLPEDRRLLVVDFDALAVSPPAQQETWTAEMEAAVSAAGHIWDGSCHALRSRYTPGTRPRLPVAQRETVVDTEGSIR